MPYETQKGLNDLDVHHIALFDAMPGSCILLKNDAPRYTILATSPDYLVQTARTKEYLIGKGLFEAFPPNYFDPNDTGTQDVMTSLNHVLRTRKSHQLPIQRYDIAGADGSLSITYWSAINKPVFSPSGDVAYIIHSAENITAQIKAAEIAKQMTGLVESEQDLQSLVLQAPIGICIIDAATLVTKVVNESFIEIAGKPLEEIVGKNYWDTFADAKPNYEDALSRVVRKGITFRATEVDVPLLRQGKKEFVNVTFIYEPIKDGNGVTKKIAVWVVDNTLHVNSRKLLQQSEQYFKQLTDTVPAIIWITKSDGSCSYLNQHWYDYTGQNAEEAKGFGWLRATHPDDKEAVGNIFLEANKNQQPFTLLYRLRSNSGEYRWCKDSGSPKFNDKGEFEGFIGTVIDVHEEKSAVEKLKESEGRLRALVNASSDVIYRMNMDWSIMYALDGKRFLSSTEAPETNWMERNVHPSEFDSVKKAIAVAIANKNTFQLEHKVVAVDGTTRWTFSRAVPLLDELGNIIEWFGAASDITARKMVEESLKKSESRFRNVIDTTPVGTAVLIGPQMKIEVANDVIIKFWQRDQNVIGKPLVEAIPELIGQSFPDLLAKVYNTGIAHTDTEALAYFINDNGNLEPAYFNYSYTALRETDGDIYGVLIMAIDITKEIIARKQIEESESRFRSIADQSPIFVFIVEPDPHAPVNYWNKTWLNYTGQSLEEAQGRAWDGIIHPDDIPTVMEIYTAAFENQKPYFIPAVRTKRHDGVYRWYSYKGTPRFSPDGIFNGYVGVGFDVHEQKITEERLESLVEERTKELAKANQTLQSTNTELQRSNGHLEEFAHAASHDLKEPVRKIHFFTNQLKDQLQNQLKEGQTRALVRIENATERMGNLIDDLLLYSHVSQKPRENEDVDLGQKVQRVLEDLELDIEEKSATIQVDELPIVKGYPRQLQQLFQNLISNGLKYSRTDALPHISISARKSSENGQTYYVIDVKDNGIGFEQEYADSIFKMFTRLHGKAEYSGTGVGLSIVKKVVENHDGVIRVTSISGEGSTFSIMLPAK